MIKPWIIGTNIEKYYNDFRSYINENDSTIIKANKINQNKYEIINEEQIPMLGDFSETKIKQFLRVLTFVGAIKPDASLSQVKTTIAPYVEYKVILKRDILENGNWQELFAKKVAKDLRWEFCKNEFISEIPTQKSFLYSVALTLITKEDKIAEEFINLTLDGTKIKSFKKYYQGIVDLIIEYEPNAKIEIRKALLGKIDTLKEIMSKAHNDIKKMDFNVDKNVSNDIRTEILTFGKFLKKGMGDSTKIKIPIYQREYRWEWNTLVNLMIDIKNIQGSNIHNIGTIMTIDERTGVTGSQLKIIDGQQRLTSLSIILRGFYDLCKAKEWRVPINIVELFDNDFGNFNSYSERFIKVKGNKDFDAFQEMINGNHENPELSKTKVSSNFMNSLQWLSANIHDDDQATNFWSKLLNGILFIVITDSNSDEYRLFEKLNTGSINLNTMELFKNHLLNKFSKIVDQNEEEFQSIFTNNILEKFKKKDSSLDEKKINTFILTILRLNGEETSQDSLFEQYKSFIDMKYIDETKMNYNLKDFKDVVDKISKDIDLFDEVTDSSKFTNKESWAYPISDFLKMLEGRTVYAPLIMKVIELFGGGLKTKNEKGIAKIREYLRAIETFEVRFQVVSYRGQSLSEKMAQVTRDLLIESTPQDLFKTLTTNGENSTSLSIQNEEAFERALLNTPLQNKIASLISLRIENFIKFKGFKYEKQSEFEGFYNKISREHILPKKYKENWTENLKQWTEQSLEEIDSNVERTTDLIGNSIIAPDWKNSSWGNLSFKDKWDKYNINEVIPRLFLFSGFRFQTNKEILELKPITQSTEFTPELIEERTEIIAKLSRIIWSNIK